MSCRADPDLQFTDYSANWRVKGRSLSAILLVGPNAPESDVKRAFAAFESLGFGPGSPFVDSGRGPRQVVGAGPGWRTTAFQAPSGEVCLEVEQDLATAGICDIGDTRRVDYSTRWIEGGKVVFGTVERGARSLSVNGIPATVVRPIDRFGIDVDLFAVEVPGGTPVTIEVQTADGSRYGVTQTPALPPPPLPNSTPPAPPSRESIIDSRAAKSVQAFVAEFASLRIAGMPGDELASFLSDDARRSYEIAEGGLSYHREDGVGDYTDFRVRVLEKVPDPDAYRVRLTMRVERGNCYEDFDEELTVGLDDEGGWLVLAATRPGTSGEGCSFGAGG